MNKLSNEELKEVKEDLIEGLKFDEYKAINHPMIYPYATIWCMCKLIVIENGAWVGRDKILMELTKHIGKDKFMYKQKGGKLNVRRLKEGSWIKWNPTDFFSKGYKEIETKSTKVSAIQRWAFILERTKLYNKWAYRIKPEYFEQIKDLIIDIENDANLNTPSEKDNANQENVVVESQTNYERKIMPKIYERTRKPIYDYFEKDVEEKLMDELDKLNLTIYQDKTNGKTGRQFDTYEVGRMDILCKDEEGNFVVIELKKGNANEQVISQIQRYVGWVQTNLAEDGQKVKGIILTERHDRNLEYAVYANPNISIKHYKINIQIMNE